MKKINILASLFAGLLIMSSCQNDRDSNPEFHDPTTFVLNTPAYVNSTYDLKSSTSIELTCSQADYGYTAPAVYAVQISVKSDFSDYEELATSYTTARMAVDASEIATAATTLALRADENLTEDDFPTVSPLYIRLKSALPSGSGEILSNIIELPNVRLYFALPAVTLPTKMYLIGSVTDWSWDKALDMVQTYAQNGTFWKLVYLPEDAEIKFNQNTSWDGGQFGAGVTLQDNANAGLSGTDNIVVGNAGWYLIVVRATLSGRNFSYTVEFNKPDVYLFGPANGGTWAAGDAFLFTVPETADDYFVSPEFSADADADSGVRACVIINGEDWWHSEFIVIDGQLQYRATGGDQDRVTGKKGQKLYINFTNGTGKIE